MHRPQFYSWLFSVQLKCRAVFAVGAAGLQVGSTKFGWFGARRLACRQEQERGFVVFPQTTFRPDCMSQSGSGSLDLSQFLPVTVKSC